MNRTLPVLFQNSVKQFGNNIYLWEKDEKFDGLTRNQIAPVIKRICGAFLAAGLQKGDRIALLAEACNNWFITEMAMLHAGIINVPLSVKILEPAEIKFRIKHAACKMIITSAFQLPKIRNIIAELTEVEKIIVFDNEIQLQSNEVFLTDFAAKGNDYFTENNIDFDTVWQNIQENDCATISYTSGTTAEPKGIMLSHRNYTANVEQAEGLFKIYPWYKTLLILPWDHCFAHTVGFFPILKNGGSIASVHIGKSGKESLKNIPVNIKELQPTFILSVPTLSKNFRKNIEKGVQDKGKLAWALFNAGLKIAYSYHQDGYTRGTGVRFLLLPLVKLFDIILFKKIRQAFGGMLLFFVGGGALLDIDLQKFFCAIGIPVYQGYGLTEASPIISSNHPGIHKFGSSGLIVPELKCRITDESGKDLSLGQKGEIVVKGENVMMGYWKNEQATKDTIKDGWLFTGDMGFLDKDGFLYVTGRFKSLLISQDGEKYSPEGIEEAIVEKSKLIDQVMLYNDHCTNTVALIVPKTDAIRKIAKDMTLKNPHAEVKKAIIDNIKHDIYSFYSGRENGGIFPDRWLPSAFAILEEGFTEQNQLMNSTMKIVRGKISEHYKSTLEFLYTAEGKDVYNNLNMNTLTYILEN